MCLPLLEKKCVVRVHVCLFGSHCSSYIVCEFCWAFQLLSPVLQFKAASNVIIFSFIVISHCTSTLAVPTIGRGWSPCCEQTFTTKHNVTQRRCCLPGVPSVVETTSLSLSFILLCMGEPCSQDFNCPSHAVGYVNITMHEWVQGSE